MMEDGNKQLVVIVFRSDDSWASTLINPTEEIAKQKADEFSRRGLQVETMTKQFYFDHIRGREIETVWPRLHW
jgi:hypothetical protein